MVWALTLVACAIVFSPRIIAYLVPEWVGLTCIGLLIFWPHTPDWMHSVVVWSIGTLLAAFLCAIPLCLFLGIPIAAGTIGCLVMILCGETVPLIGKVWVGITSGIGAITPAHWAIVAMVIAGTIFMECRKAWRRRVPRPMADDDDDFDDNFDDDPTDSRIALRMAPLRPPTRAERKKAAIYAEFERKAKLSAAWQAWYDGRGPRPF